MPKNSAQNTAISFILGVAAGAVAGILLAPDSGKNTRTKVKQAAIDLKDTVSSSVEDGYSKINQLKEEAIAAVNKTIKKGEDAYKGASQTASNEVKVNNSKSLLKNLLLI